MEILPLEETILELKKLLNIEDESYLSLGMIKKYSSDRIHPYEGMSEEYKNSGHIWKMNSYSGVDIFALDSGYCNGPECLVCGQSFCHHCTKNPGKCNG